jgi:hypothetical protein
MSLLEKPIVVLGCNRSGTTLLFNNLSAHPAAWSLRIESQEIFYRYHPLDPVQGERVTQPPSAEEAREIHQYFFHATFNRERFQDTPMLRRIPPSLFRPWLQGRVRRPPLRLVEKTPANTLRVPYLARLFPDAKFVFLVRRGEDVVSSLMEGWENWSGTGRAWHFTKWHYLAPPGWQAMRDKPLQEICAFQWLEANRTAWSDLRTHCAGRFRLFRHEEVMAEPERAYEELRDFCELPRSDYYASVVRRIRERVFTTGGSRPRKEKWRELHGAEVESVRHLLEPLQAQLYPSGV